MRALAEVHGGFGSGTSVFDPQPTAVGLLASPLFAVRVFIQLGGIPTAYTGSGSGCHLNVCTR